MSQKQSNYTNRGKIKCSLIVCASVVFLVSIIVQNTRGQFLQNPYYGSNQIAINSGIYEQPYHIQNSIAYPIRRRNGRGQNFFQVLASGLSGNRNRRQFKMNPYYQGSANNYGYVPGPPPQVNYVQTGSRYPDFRRPPSPYLRPGPPRLPMLFGVQKMMNSGMKMIKDAFITMPGTKVKGQTHPRNPKADPVTSASSESTQTADNAGTKVPETTEKSPDPTMMDQMMHTMNMTKQFIERHENLITGGAKLMAYGIDMISFFGGNAT